MSWAAPKSASLRKWLSASRYRFRSSRQASGGSNASLYRRFRGAFAAQAKGMVPRVTPPKWSAASQQYHRDELARSRRDSVGTPRSGGLAGRVGLVLARPPGFARTGPAMRPFLTGIPQTALPPAGEAIQ